MSEPVVNYPGEYMLGRERAKANYERQVQEEKTRAALKKAKQKRRLMQEAAKAAGGQ